MWTNCTHLFALFSFFLWWLIILPLEFSEIQKWKWRSVRRQCGLGIYSVQLLSSWLQKVFRRLTFIGQWKLFMGISVQKSVLFDFELHMSAMKTSAIPASSVAGDCEQQPTRLNKIALIQWSSRIVAFSAGNRKQNCRLTWANAGDNCWSRLSKFVRAMDSLNAHWGT